MPLSLPAADLAVVIADIADAPVVRWLRALTSWAGTGRGVAEFARVPPADMAGLSALLGFDDAPKKRCRRRARLGVDDRGRGWGVAPGGGPGQRCGSLAASGLDSARRKELGKKPDDQLATLVVPASCCLRTRMARVKSSRIR